MKNRIVNLFHNALSLKNKSDIDHLLFTALVRQQKGVNIFEGKIDSVEIADEVKIGVWVGIKDQWGSSSLEFADEAHLKAAVDNARNVARYTDEDADFTLAPASPAKITHAVDPAIQALSIKDLESRALGLERHAKDFSPFVKNIPYAACGYDHFARVIVNSQSVSVAEENAVFKASLSMIAAGKDRRDVNYSDGEHYLKFNDFDPWHFAHKIGEETIGRMEPKPVSTGAHPILFDASTAAQLLSTFAPVFSGDFLYRGLTRLEGKLGQSIANPIVSIMDQGEGGLILHHYDAEGTPLRPKAVIQEGRFESFLHNRYTAKKAKASSTGNAGGGQGSAIDVSPANISWEGNVTPVSQIMASMDKGILIKELHGSSTSPITGDFSFGALGYWVEGGRKSHPIADFTVAGNFFDLLKNIEALGDDPAYFSPHPLGSAGGRSLRVSSLSVSGN